MRRRALGITTVILMTLSAIPAGAAPPETEYVVVLNPTGRQVHELASEISATVRGEVGFVYSAALQGFTITVPAQAANALERNPKVAYVEPVRTVEAVGTQPVPTGVDRVEGDLNPVTETMDVDIAILDTGVYIGNNPDGSARSHLDLNLRYVSDCTSAWFYPDFGPGCKGSGSLNDDHGHGTHVAGIAAAYDNDIGSIGTAPGATLWSFKVLRSDGTGTTGMILAGIDAVAANADQIEVANLSLGFQGTSQALNDGIAGATDAGVVFVVAAGNDSIPASEFSPANSPDVITVSALADFDGLPGGLGAPTCRTDQDDTLADFSNYGPDVEIAAPGVCIYSTYLNDGYATMSGTSMASPAVAGAVARLIAEGNLPTADRADVEAIKSAVIGAGVAQTSSCGFTGDVDSSPEPLLFVNGPAFGGDGTCEDGSVVNTPPDAQFSYSCVDLTCDFTDESTDSDGTVIGHAWEFGDGGTSPDQSPSHVFATAGTYTVELTVTDDAGDTDFASAEVTVSDTPAPNQAPIAGFTTDCRDLGCTFTNTSTDPDGDPLTYTWDFGDGEASTATDPTHSYAVAGSYTVTLTTSDGTDTDTATTTVTVDEPPGSTVVTAGVYPMIVNGRDAEVPVGVFDSVGEFVGGATVSGVWTYLDRRGREKTATDTVTSTDAPETNPFGNAVFTRRFPRNVEIVSFCLTSIEAAGYTYSEPPITCSYPSP